MEKENKSVEIIGMDGKNHGSMDLDVSSVDEKKSKRFVSDILLMYMSNQKKRTASTKSRHEINKTNKKPWKQKGTGRARAGSARSPIWVGGGVACGPKPRDVYFDIPKKLRKKALKDAFLMKAIDGEISIINELKVDAIGTKEASQIIKNLNLGDKLLIVTEGIDKNLVLSVRNIPKVAAMTVNDINAFDIVKAKKLLFTKNAFEIMNKRIAA